MPAPVTQTEIVNAAAALLGSTERITSLAGGGNLARHANAVWDLTVRGLMADHPWNAFIEEAPLNLSATTGSARFGYRAALPASCLRLLSIGDEHAWRYPEERAVEGGYIYTDIEPDAEEPTYARFVSAAKLNNCAAWAPHFAVTVTDHLAVALCAPLTSEKGTQAALTDRAAASLARAKRIDGLESQGDRRPQFTRRSNWLTGLHYPYNRYSR